MSSAREAIQLLATMQRKLGSKSEYASYGVVRSNVSMSMRLSPSQLFAGFHLSFIKRKLRHARVLSPLFISMDNRHHSSWPCPYCSRCFSIREEIHDHLRDHLEVWLLRSSLNPTLTFCSCAFAIRYQKFLRSCSRQRGIQLTTAYAITLKYDYFASC